MRTASTDDTRTEVRDERGAGAADHGAAARRRRRERLPVRRSCARGADREGLDERARDPEPARVPDRGGRAGRRADGGGVHGDRRAEHGDPGRGARQDRRQALHPGGQQRRARAVARARRPGHHHGRGARRRHLEELRAARVPGGGELASRGGAGRGGARARRAPRGGRDLVAWMRSTRATRCSTRTARSRR